MPDREPLDELRLRQSFEYRKRAMLANVANIEFEENQRFVRAVQAAESERTRVISKALVDYDLACKRMQEEFEAALAEHEKEAEQPAKEPEKKQEKPARKIAPQD